MRALLTDAAAFLLGSGFPKTYTWSGGETAGFGSAVSRWYLLLVSLATGGRRVAFRAFGELLFRLQGIPKPRQHRSRMTP